jgi:dihydroorotase
MLNNNTILKTFEVDNLVDFHVHVFEHNGYLGFNLNPEVAGTQKNVPRVVDQGGAGALNLVSFKKKIVDKSTTNVQCFVSPYLIGGNPRGEIGDIFGPTGMNVEKTVDAVMSVDSNFTFVRGVKAHCGPSNYDQWGIEPLIIAEQIASKLNLPIYLHLGSMHNFNNSRVDSGVILEKVLETLRPGDILAHPYRPENGIVQSDGKIHPLFKAFKNKGVLIDVGRGTKYSYHVAKTLLAEGYFPEIISSDLHGFTHGKISLLQAMDEMLHFGMDVNHIIKAVTDTPSGYLNSSNSCKSTIVLTNLPKTYSDSEGEHIDVEHSFAFL